MSPVYGVSYPRFPSGNPSGPNPGTVREAPPARRRGRERGHPSPEGVSVIVPTAVHAETAGRLRAAIARLGRMLRQHNDGDLTLTQWSALISVEAHGTVRIGDLAEIEHVSASTGTRLVATLEDRGLLERSGDVTDRRSAYVSLTAAGVHAIAEMRRTRTEHLAQRLATLSEEDLRRVQDALSILERLADD